MAGEDQNTDTIASAATSTMASMTPQFIGPMTQFGPTTPNVPSPVTFQPPQQQNFAKPQGSFATVGERKRADRQAILQNTAQLVKSGADYIQQNKYRTLQMNIQNLMEYSKGIQEAQQVIQDPNSTPQQKQQAQQTLISNIQNSNAIVHNTKNSKMLQNAYNVDLFGKSKDPKANQALFSAMAEFQKKQAAGDQTALDPRVQRIMQSQPQRLQLSPEAQQQAAMIKAGLIPKAAETLKANVELYKSFQAADTAEKRNAVLEENAKLLAASRDRATQASIDNMNKRVLGEQAAAKIRASAEYYRVNTQAQEWDKRIAAMKDIAGMRQFVPQLKIYTEQLKTLSAENKAAQIELDKKGTSILGMKFGATSSQDAIRLRTTIFKNQLQMQDIEQKLNSFGVGITALDRSGMSNIGGGESDNTVTVEDSDVPDEN